MGSQQKNKKRKRRAMLVAMLGNVWEARGLARIRENVADFEASGAVEKARELQYATDRAKVLDVQTAIETAGSESLNAEGEKYTQVTTYILDLKVKQLLKMHIDLHYTYMILRIHELHELI